MEDVYSEHAPPAGLQSIVACTWEQTARADRRQRIVPDGCVDLIWMADQRLVIAGADTSARDVALPAGARITGIRLRPGAAGAVLGVPACELRDRDVPAVEVWGAGGRRLQDAIAAAAHDQRAGLLSAAVAQRGATPDRLVVAAAGLLANPGARVETVAAALGVSSRTLHRRTLTAVGYRPKMLARVARLRRLMGLQEPSLASRAYAAGYASQAHMTEEVRRLTGVTPVRFLEDVLLTAA
jgi:methylphosphotriester-DNA--protein-cysteine methyltransferase